MVVSFFDDNPSACLRAAFSVDDIRFHHRFKASTDSAYRNACYGQHLSNSYERMTISSKFAEIFDFVKGKDEIIWDVYGGAVRVYKWLRPRQTQFRS